MADLAMPGMRLQRLVNYRRAEQAARRFAALYYDDDGAIAPSGGWIVDADDVSSRLEQRRAYPLDLDAVGHGLSVRFALVAAA
jgi:hypothetical protein